MQDLRPTAFGKTLVLLKTHPLPGQIKSLLHANRLALAHLGHGTSTCADEKGGILRRIRLDRGIDPALLATEACISLAQLYAIETGEEGLFYSAYLREHTARRVANLLNADWNNLSAHHLTIKSFSNVFHLPRAAALHTATEAVNTAAMIQKPESSPQFAQEESSAIFLTKQHVVALDQNGFVTVSDPDVQANLRAKNRRNWQWLALILAAYAVAVFVTLGFDTWSNAHASWRSFSDLMDILIKMF
jgi:transcriptional regulator with XRE-family HTH domain